MRYKYIKYIFIFLFILFTLLAIYNPWFIFLDLALTIIYIILLVYGSIRIKSNFYIETLCSGKKDKQNESEKKVIALSFDDGPDRNTLEILDILKAYNIKAVFFCVGEKVEANKEIVERIYSDGHLVGNHSYSHKSMFPFYSVKSLKRELDKTSDVIRKTIGKKPKLFRPPYGVTNPGIAKAIKITGYTTIGWSLRSYDTTIKTPEKVMVRLKRKLKDNEIVLFHDTGKNINIILKEFLEYIVKENYSAERLDKILSIEAYV